MRILAIPAAVLVFSVCGWGRELARYAVVLNGPAAARVASTRDVGAMSTARAGVRRSHEGIKAELRSRNIQVTGEADTMLNAVFVAADPTQIDQVKALPGVSYVAKMPRYHRELDAAEQLIQVPAAWTNSLIGGQTNAGAGIKIGIIDTGIDVTHPAFQDSNLTPPAGFPKCDVPSDCTFTNNKVIVARSYVAMVAAGSGSNPAIDSRPDDYSARDRVGHGTAVAMAAAGMTNSGPSDTITGVAPKAFLGSYKVFGSPGVNDFTSGDAIISALEDALNDHMDIVVLSLGGTAVYGPLDSGKVCGAPTGQPCDVIAYYVQQVVSSGMVVVAAAGNEGSIGSVLPSLGTISSPGDAPDAIAVAATTNSHSFSNALTVNGLDTFHSTFGTGPLPAGTFTGTLADVANVGDPLACTGFPANSLAGAVALVQRGTCTFIVKTLNAQAAGAAGVIFTNSQGDNSLLSPGGLAGTTNIPTIFIGYDDGQSIRGYLKSKPQATVSISPNVVPFSVATFNQVAGFTSRGPVLGSGFLKPDVAAVGTDLYLAAQSYDPNGDLYSANGYIVSQGTSFSTPQIAGVAALVLQAHPGLTPAQVKSLVVNTATQDVLDNGSPASVLAVGAGKANAAAAVASSLTASPTGISFGVLPAVFQGATQALQLTNIGASALNLSVTINRRTAESNAHLSLDQPNLTIAAGQTTVLNLTLTGTAPAAGSYEGFVTIQGAASTLQIPYLYEVGDGVPFDIISVAGDGDNGIPGQQNSEGLLLFQVLDRYGLPVSGQPVRFSVTAGGGRLVRPDTATDSYGFAGSNDLLGPGTGANVFTATAGALSTTFTIISTPQPAILANGAVNAANFLKGQGAAPGSYISLFGSSLANGAQGFSTPYLPVSIGGVSVSFDTPSFSAPGRLWFVSPGQVNVEVPWELQQALSLGQTSAQIKVNANGNSGAIYNLALASYSPAFFEVPAGFAASLDQNNNVVSSANPVAPGSTVQLFLNGLGPVTNQPASGDPASLTTLSTTPTTPVVTIGGLNADVKFSGLAPGSLGLYQVNAVVPNAAAGLQTITISIGGVQSSASSIAIR